MAVTRRVLHLPPYISTSWENVIALHMEQDEDSDEPLLVVTLQGGAQIGIPNLREEIAHELFALHAQILAGEENLKCSQELNKAEGLFEPEEMLKLLICHQPALCDEQPMPEEVECKLQSIGQLLDRDILARLKRPVDNCNCPFCQVHRALLTDLHNEAESTEDLPDTTIERMQSGKWVINTKDQSTFTVFTEESPQERFQVCLGECISCTCGQANCEHVKAVLLT